MANAITNNSAVTSSAGITTTETYVTPTTWVTNAQAPVAGDTYNVTLGGTINSTGGVPTFNLRMGPNNSVADPIICTIVPNVSNTGTAQPFKATFSTTVRVAGTAFSDSTTITNASPGIVLGNTIAPTASTNSNTTITVTNASFYVGGTVVFATTSGNITAGTTYYVLSLISTTGITIGLTAGGSAITATATATLGAATSGVFSVGSVVSFSATVGTTGGQVVQGTNYYVVSFVPSTLTAQVAATPGGTPITFNAGGTPNMVSQLVLNSSTGAVQVVGVLDGNLRSVHAATPVVIPTVGVTSNGATTGIGVSVVTTASTDVVTILYANITKSA